MEKIPSLEAILKNNQKQFSVNFPDPIFFSSNEVRKNSPHRSVCLTLLNENQNPIAVLKHPLTNTEIANESLKKEYQTLLQMHQTQPQVVPTPLGMCMTEIGLMVLYEYIPHKMVYRSLYETQKVFEPVYFTKPIDWLISWNQATLSGAITKEFLEKFKSDFFEMLARKYVNLAPLLSQIWNMSQPLFDSMVAEKIPAVSMHGDFNVLNIGLRKEGALVILDWEDAQEKYPILFDFFYFVIGFYWYLFDDRATSIVAESVPKNIKALNTLIDQYLIKYEEIFGLNLKTVNALFILFLFHSLSIDLAEKRQSEEAMILRWLDMLTHLGGTNFLTHNLEIREDFYIKKLTRT